MNFISLFQKTAPLVDIILIIVVKILAIVGFIALMKYFVKKTDSIVLKIAVWAFGFFFTLMMPFTLLEALVPIIISFDNPDNIGAVAALASIIFYVWISMNIIKTKNKK